VKRSAGVLLWRRISDGSVEVLLAHPGGPYFAAKDEAHWSIPKGEIDADEDDWRAAAREVSEELGIPVPGGQPVSLGEAKQSSAKVNVIFAVEGDPGPFEVSSNLFDMEWPPRSGKRALFPEVDRASWFGLDEARGKLFASQRTFLDRLNDLLRSTNDDIP
jgi:predicted NUDIX family NTP pyrophosphohydrolase